MLQKVRRGVGLLTIALLCGAASVAVSADKKAGTKDEGPQSFVQYTVDSYQITYFGTGKGRPDVRAWLILYSKENKTGVAGAIGFYTPEGLKRASDYLDGDARPQGAMPIADLPAILNTLQASKLPIRLYWSGGPWQTTFLDSASQPLTRSQVEAILESRRGEEAAAAGARDTSYKVRVYNNTDVELRVRILHPASGDEWAVPGLLEAKNGKSRIQQLRSGDRVIIAIDPIKDKVLLAEKFELTGGMRIKLLGNSPDIKLSLEAVAGMGDP